TDEDGGAAAGALRLARERGCLTVGFSTGSGAEWEFDPPTADRHVRQELIETLYHVLWELVHVFFEHRGLLEGRERRPTHDAGAAGWPSRAAIDLTEDPAILTAIANDIGPDAMFARQVIAYGRPDDVLLALSTSGNSRNVIDALAQARRQGLGTIAMVGYDGG